MRISATVVADSLPYWGAKKRLTTMVITYPRFIHSEFMTHRVFSRNAASSRAIPVKKMLKQVWSDPAMPLSWGKNKPGMQAAEELQGWRLMAVQKSWRAASKVMVAAAWGLDKLGLHKQVANRILEPWMWMHTIVTATEWANFFHLRRHPDAQPEIKALADVMYTAMRASTPTQLQTGQWHLPFVSGWEVQEHGIENARKLSAARCARVSYLNHDGTKPDVAKDLQLHDRLVQAPHASPFEHQATPAPYNTKGNFIGWMQYRSLIPNENHTLYVGL
jgi:hypothetical protein